MVIISKQVLRSFADKHPDTIEPLNKWYEIVKKADWNSFADIKKAF
jgi:mRNA interferase HigB